MLVFGPYPIIPKDMNFIIYNLSSLVQVVPRLPGLLPTAEMLVRTNNLEYDEYMEKSFDMWYYDYVLNDPIACSSLMTILQSLYDGNNVYVCINDYESNSTMSIINESFMKIIQSRYDIKYYIVNTPEDFQYISSDGCDFMSVAGIMEFDRDRKRYMQLMEEQRILGGGTFSYE